MKKALICGLSAAVFLASLSACGTAQANQPSEPDPTPSAVQTEPVETPNPVPTLEPMSAADDSSIGAIDLEFEKIDLTDDQLELFFESVYEICQLGSTEETLEGKIQEELVMLEYFFSVDDTAIPPDDYEARYRAWRPEEEVQTTQGTQGTQTQSQQSGTTHEDNQQGNQNNQQTVNNGQQTTSSNDTAPKSNNSGGSSIYGGFSTYEEYINDLQNQYPDYSREQIMEAFPDLGTLFADEAVGEQDKKDGLLSHAN